ncbi:MAG TPA: hypothetical protein DCS43_01515 [Verrucomicrobia bacterium]|nr:hypothetical protein [Verrucomicrobiota bacterium]
MTSPASILALKRYLTACPALILGAVFFLLAVGGAGIFPWTLFIAALALSIALHPWQVFRQPLPRWHELVRSPYVLLLVYLLLMLIPFPGWLSGETRQTQNQTVIEALDAVRAAGIEHGIRPLFSLSRSRSGTLRMLLLVILAYSGWRLSAGCSRPQQVNLLRGLLLIATVMALAGIIGKWIYPQGSTLWWMIPVPHGRPGPMGGFMNRNHFAGFCALLAPAAFALSLHDLQRRRIVAALASLLASTVLVGAVLASLSRGGFVALLGGLACLMVIVLWRGNIALRIAALVLPLLLGAALVGLSLRYADLGERIASLRNPLSTTSLQDRLDAWRDSIRIWQTYPLLGAGPNAFRVVYPQHRQTSARDARDYAENEYVQWFCESGVAGTLMALIIVATLCRQVIRSLRQRTDAESLMISTAAVTAMAVAATHALVDFPLHLPLYALTLAILAGMLTKDAAEPRRRNPPWQAAAGLLMLIALVPADLKLDNDGRITCAGFTDTARALTAAPLSPVAWRRLAALLWQENTESSRLLSERCLTQAAAYDPNNYPLWQNLGDRRMELGDNRRAMEAYRRVKTLRAWVDVPTELPEEP